MNCEYFLLSQWLWNAILLEYFLTNNSLSGPILGWILNTKQKLLVVIVLLVTSASGEDPYRFYTWNVTYGDIHPLGVKQQGILINRQFPGQQIEFVTNEFGRRLVQEKSHCK